MKIIDADYFRIICEESQTMAIACSKLGLHFNTFKRLAIKYGCYKPNQGGKGLRKEPKIPRSISIEEILDGKHPSFQTHKIKGKLLQAGIFKNECSNCGINEWLGKSLVCELDHIDGNRFNHKLDNLRMLCPNCHSQTSTFRSKKRISQS